MDEFDVFVVRFESNVNRRELPIPGLQRVFGIDEATAQKIARSLPRIVKSRVSLDIAERYVEALRLLGAQVELRPCVPRSNQTQPSPPSAAVADVPPILARTPESTADRGELNKNSTTVLGTIDAPEADNDAGSSAHPVGSETIGIQSEPQGLQTQPQESFPAESRSSRPVETTDRSKPMENLVIQPEAAFEHASGSAPSMPVAESRQPLMVEKEERLDWLREVAWDDFPSKPRDASDEQSQAPLEVKQPQTIESVQPGVETEALADSVSPPTAENRNQSEPNTGVAVSRQVPNDSANGQGAKDLPALDGVVAGAIGQFQTQTRDTSGQVSDQPRAGSDNQALQSGPVYSQHTHEPGIARSDRRRSEPALAFVWKPGMGDILGGASLIAIGIFIGHSMFIGNAGVFDYLFDAAGICWVGLGVYKLVTKSSTVRG